MKPNLIVVQPPDCIADERVEQLCETLCESHYVYLIRPASRFRADSPGGVRFLSHSLQRLPGFAEVDTVIAIREPAVAERLKEAYPHSNLHFWDPAEDHDLPEAIRSKLERSRIVEGDFSQRPDAELARAI